MQEVFSGRFSYKLKAGIPNREIQDKNNFKIR